MTVTQMHESGILTILSFGLNDSQLKNAINGTELVEAYLNARGDCDIVVKQIRQDLNRLRDYARERGWDKNV